MILILNSLALLLLSIFAPDGPPPKLTFAESLVQQPKLKELVFVGEENAVRGYLEDILRRQTVPGFDAESLVTGVAGKLVPGISALVIVNELLSLQGDSARRKRAGELVGQGVFRRLGVTFDVAPVLVRLSVERGWKNNSALLEQERRRLLLENQRLLDPFAAAAGDR